MQVAKPLRYLKARDPMACLFELFTCIVRPWYTTFCIHFGPSWMAWIMSPCTLQYNSIAFLLEYCVSTDKMFICLWTQSTFSSVPRNNTQVIVAVLLNFRGGGLIGRMIQNRRDVYFNYSKVNSKINFKHHTVNLCVNEVFLYNISNVAAVAMP